MSEANRVQAKFVWFITYSHNITTDSEKKRIYTSSMFKIQFMELPACIRPCIYDTHINHCNILFKYKCRRISAKG